jgi:hypothetical protein
MAQRSCIRPAFHLVGGSTQRYGRNLSEGFLCGVHSPFDWAKGHARWRWNLS